MKTGAKRQLRPSVLDLPNSEGVWFVRHVIIGSSAAGVAAAETIRKLDPNSEILMISEETGLPYSRCLTPEFLAGRLPEERLRIRPKDFYVRNGILAVLGYRVTAVLPEEKAVILNDGRRINYHKLLIATGSSTAFPPIPGIDNQGVFGLRSLADAKALLEAARGARRAVVIGAGPVGLEAAYALYERGIEVTVVERFPRILFQQLDEEASGILARDLQAEGVRILTGRGVKEIVGPSLWSRLFGKTGKGVILDSGEKLKAEIIVVATGTRPNTGLVKGSAIVVNRGIRVNGFMETTVPGVYAAGDVAETTDAVSGVTGLSPIWPNAVAQGKVAGYNMAGKPRELSLKIGMQNAMEFRMVPAIAVGITNPAGEDYQELKVHRPEENLYRKLVFQGNLLRGMILVGDIEQAGVLAALIKNKVNVSKFKNRLLEKSFSFADFVH